MSQPRRHHSTRSPTTMVNPDSFQKQPSLAKNVSKHRTTLPPPTRVNTMKPIAEQQQQQVYQNKPAKKRNQSRRLHNTLDDDIPLALLAYKKGYTTIYPYSNIMKDDRTNSYVSTSSSGSSSQNSIIKQQNSKRKKSRHHQNLTPVPADTKQVIEEPVIKEKKWYSSLRKLIK